jgi:hypothetical protein
LLASRVTALPVEVAPTTMLVGLSVASTTATGTFVTVIVAAPFTPSLVAVIVALPALTPVTAPPALTVATAVLLLAHVIVRPVSTLLLASRVTAAPVDVAPTTILAGVSVAVTDATGAFDTVIVAVPFTLSLVAVIVALPALTPVTTPLPLTVATAVLLLAHVTVRPVSTLLPASRVTAVPAEVAPTTILAGVSVAVTDATGTFDTVTVAALLTPSLTAMICAVPGATADTTPAADTVATAVLVLVHTTARPDSG